MRLIKIAFCSNMVYDSLNIRNFFKIYSRRNAEVKILLGGKKRLEAELERDKTHYR